MRHFDTAFDAIFWRSVLIQCLAQCLTWYFNTVLLQAVLSQGSKAFLPQDQIQDPWIPRIRWRSSDNPRSDNLTIQWSSDPVIRPDNPIFLLKDQIQNPEFSGSSCDQVMILDPIEAKSLPRSGNHPLPSTRSVSKTHILLLFSQASSINTCGCLASTGTNA